MCGRYTLGANITELEKRFDLGRQDLRGLITRRYNIAPTQEVLAITNNGGRQAELLRWGLMEKGQPGSGHPAESSADACSLATGLVRPWERGGKMPPSLWG